MPRGRLTTTGSVLGKNRNTHKKTNHEQKKDSSAKKRITAEEYRKHKREIDQLLRGLKGKSSLREAELD